MTQYINPQHLRIKQNFFLIRINNSHSHPKYRIPLTSISPFLEATVLTTVQCNPLLFLRYPHLTAKMPRTAITYEWSCCECNRNNSMRYHPYQCSNPRCNHVRVSDSSTCGACYLIESRHSGR